MRGHRKRQADVHSAGISFHRSIEKFFHAGEIDNRIESQSVGACLNLRSRKFGISGKRIAWDFVNPHTFLIHSRDSERIERLLEAFEIRFDWIRDYRLHAEARGGIMVDRDYDPSLPNATLDRNQLIQALLNVARNALQAVGQQPADYTGRIVLRTRAMSNVSIGPARHRLVASRRTGPAPGRYNVGA